MVPTGGTTHPLNYFSFCPIQLSGNTCGTKPRPSCSPSRLAKISANQRRCLSFPMTRNGFTHSLSNSFTKPSSQDSNHDMAQSDAVHASSSSSSSARYSEIWNYLWIPLLISSSKELSLARAVESMILTPTQRGNDCRDLSVPRCPAPDAKLYFRPVIGILSHPGDGASGRLNDSSTASYIAASYVKFVESAGARVIPLIYNEPPEVLYEVLSKLGLLNWEYLSLCESRICKLMIHLDINFW